MEILYLTQHVTSLPDYDEFDVYDWASEDLPNMIECATIIAEIPSSQENHEEIIEEIEQAQQTGTDVIWLLSKESNIELAEEIFENKILLQKRRREIKGFTVTDPEFNELCNHAIANYFTFKIPKNWRSIAYIRNPMFSIAAAQISSKSGSTLLISKPIEAIEHISSLVDALESLKERVISQPPKSNSFRHLLILFVAFAFFITGSRYIQKAENLELREMRSGNIDINRWATTHDRYLSRLALNEDLYALGTINPSESMDEKRIGKLLEFFDRYGLYGQERKFLEYLLNSSSQLWAREFGISYVQKDIFREMGYRLQDRDYEMARFRAQQYLNYTYSLKSNEYLGYYSDQTNVANKVVDLIRGNFPYGFEGILRALRKRTLSRYPETDEVLKQEPPPNVYIHASLQDNIAYENAVSTSQDLPIEERYQVWESFLQEFPNSEKAEEARFNIIFSKFGNEDRSATTKICFDFIEDFPRSYLADDVLRMGLLLSGLGGDVAAAFKSLSQLVNNYIESDTWKLMEGRVVSLDSFNLLSEKKKNGISKFFALVASSSPPSKIGDIVGPQEITDALPLIYITNVFGIESREDLLKLRVDEFAMTFAIWLLGGFEQV